MLGFCCLTKNCLAVHAERAVPRASALGAEQEERFANREVRQRVVIRPEPSVVRVIERPVDVSLSRHIPLEVTITGLSRETESAGFAGLRNLIRADRETERERVRQIALHDLTNEGQSLINSARDEDEETFTRSNRLSGRRSEVSIVRAVVRRIDERVSNADELKDARGIRNAALNIAGDGSQNVAGRVQRVGNQIEAGFQGHVDVTNGVD